VATIRELLGNGTWLGIRILPQSYNPMLIAILAPGAFFTLGFLMAAINMLKEKR
jgi:electron transport complex protein RnfE